MKKLVSFVVVMLLTVTNVCASTTLPSFVSEPIYNYSGDYSISMTFDSSDEIVALLDELEFSESVENYVELKTLLKTLFSYDGKMSLQADISEDYNKIKLALTTENDHSIVINPNFNIGFNMKMGLWLDINMENEEKPVFNMIVSHPFLNKYVTINAFDEYMTEEDIKAFKAVFNKEYIQNMTEAYMDIFAEYVKVEGTKSKYTMKMDNDDFTSYMDEIIKYMAENIPYTEEEYNIYQDFPSMKGLKILGDGGIEYTYKEAADNSAKLSSKADISINISEIYEQIAGEEWEYTSEGIFDFTIGIDADITNIGTTEVKFPVLTDKNSVSAEEIGMYNTYEEYEEYEEIPPYPLWSSYGYTDTLPIINDEIYVPLRMTLEGAYEDSVNITYNNGLITAQSEYFNGFKMLTTHIGSQKAYADSVEYNVGDVLLIDGVTYVNSRFFEDVFGWELAYAEYNLLYKEYYYNFHTNREY